MTSLSCVRVRDRCIFLLMYFKKFSQNEALGLAAGLVNDDDPPPVSLLFFDFCSLYCASLFFTDDIFSYAAKSHVRL